MLTELALRHRSTVFFLVIAALVLGVLAYVQLPREKYPDIQVPMIIAYVEYPGASPAEVESQLTHPLERELNGVSGLKELTSVSQDSLSVVTAEFLSGTDIDVALQKVRDRVDRAKVDFPDEAEEPVLTEISFSDVPVLQVHLAGDVGPVELKRLAEDLQEEIEALPGVLRVAIAGGREREVKVDVRPDLLRLRGLSLNDVVDAVRDGNVSIPGGELDLGDLTYTVRLPGEVEDPLELADFVIDAPDGKPVAIRDLAEVSFGFEDRASTSRIDGQESVALAVTKRIGANVVDLNREIRATVEHARIAWPAGVRVVFLGDLSKEIEQQVVDLENSILSGLFLVVLVLMFSLGLRNALFVGMAIPFSMLLTFLVIQLSGITLNMVVLFALVLAVGMLVDNAVVVVENIYRHIQDGKPRFEAARVGTREVGAAITVSTLTTVGAFFPLLSWPGVLGDFMRYLPLTVSIALLASLVVGLTANPTICSVFMATGSSVVETGRESRGGGLVRRVREGYLRLLEWALDHRAVMVVGSILVFLVVVSCFGVWNQGVELLPDQEPNQIRVDVDLPPGTRVEKTDRVIREIEQRLSQLPDTRVVASGAGEGSRDDGFGGRGDAHLGRLAIDLVDRKERTRSSFVTLDETRRLAGEIPGAVIEAGPADLSLPVGAPLSLELTGDDFTVLGEIAARIRREIADIPGLVSLDDDYDLARPEVVVTVDRVAAARLDLSTVEIARTLRTAVGGTEASTYRRGDEEIDITVRLAEASRASIEDLRRLLVVNEQGDQVPLEAVATVERGASLTAIRHKNRRRMVTVSGDVTEPRFAETVRAEALRRLDAIPGLLPPGYGVQVAGQQEDEEESKEFLSRAFLYALVIVLVLMVAKFDSVLIPLVILSSVMMSMVGVLLGLMITRMPFSIIMTGVGVISLAGIVVNNAIVLLDYGEQLRAAGMPRREMLLTTGARRFRPVMLTAATTILGLLPLTTGVELDFHTFEISTGSDSSQYWRAMGVAVIFGLGFATFLTLVLVPVLYDLVLSLGAWWEKRRQSGIEVGEDPERTGEDLD